jgi:hypothetical protein
MYLGLGLGLSYPGEIYIHVGYPGEELSSLKIYFLQGNRLVLQGRRHVL